MGCAWWRCCPCWVHPCAARSNLRQSRPARPTGESIDHQNGGTWRKNRIDRRRGYFYSAPPGDRPSVYAGRPGGIGPRKSATLARLLEGPAACRPSGAKAAYSQLRHAMLTNAARARERAQARLHPRAGQPRAHRISHQEESPLCSASVYYSARGSSVIADRWAQRQADRPKIF